MCALQKSPRLQCPSAEPPPPSVPLPPPDQAAAICPAGGQTPGHSWWGAGPRLCERGQPACKSYTGASFRSVGSPPSASPSRWLPFQRPPLQVMPPRSSWAPAPGRCEFLSSGDGSGTEQEPGRGAGSFDLRHPSGSFVAGRGQQGGKLHFSAKCRWLLSIELSSSQGCKRPLKPRAGCGGVSGAQGVRAKSSL